MVAEHAIEKTIRGRGADDRDGKVIRDSGPLEGLDPGGNFGPEWPLSGLRGARTGPFLLVSYTKALIPRP